MEIIIAVAGKGQGSQATIPGFYAQLFFQFAYKRHFGRFTWLNLTAGKFPQPSHGFALRALRNQHAPIGINQRNRRNQNRFHER